jgi:hypothetical protein
MTDDNSALLKEYELCEQHVHSMSHEIWTSTTIFISATVVLLTGIVYATISSDLLADIFSGCRYNTNIWSQLIPLFSILIVGIGIILIFFHWIAWLKRMKFLTVVNYVRMRQIEKILGMRKNWLAFGYDLEDDPNLSNPSNPPPEGLEEELEMKRKEIPYARAAGFDGLIKIARIIIGIWGTFGAVILSIMIYTLCLHFIK